MLTLHMDLFSSLLRPHREWPLGARGETPAFIPEPSPLEWAEAKMLGDWPGVKQVGGGFQTTWDMAPFLANELKVQCPPIPLSDPAEYKEAVKALPGYDDYWASDFPHKLRDYQRSGAAFLALRSYAINADPCRSGKTAQAIAGAVLTGAKKTLIVCPSLVKLGWASEIAKWTGDEAVILETLNGSTARVFCATCGGRGYTETEKHCSACKLRNGQSHGLRILERDNPDRDLDAGIAAARWVIVNYELIVPRVEKDSQGGVYINADQPGWNPFLGRFTFDLGIADECHFLRGRTTDRKKVGITRRDKFNQLMNPIPQVWGLSATPVYGYVRDLWGQLDALSKGAVTGPDRLFFQFTQRYCCGHRGEYGWEDTGRSPLAGTELAERMDLFKIQRPRSLILASMPPKQRMVHRLNPDAAATKGAKDGARKLQQGGSQASSKLSKLIAQTCRIKLDFVTENVCDQLAQDQKVVVFCLMRDSAKRMAKELDRKLSKSRAWSARMRAVNAKMWFAHGSTDPKNRFAMCRQFREHKGAAVFVTTIDAVQVGVSLKGATSVHFADMHWSPAAMLQAEDRPYEPGVTGLTIEYYVVQGSIDEHIEVAVLPKFRAQDLVLNEEGARDVAQTLAGPEETMKQIADRLTAHLAEEAAEDEELAAILAD